MASRTAPALYIDADMSEGIYASSFISEFARQMSTPAHKKTVMSAMHTSFANEFDKYISRRARLDPSYFHHVYEYSNTGDPYSRIGEQTAQLWEHVMVNQTGEMTTFSWKWKVAKMPNPTYEQRIESNVGFDAIREVAEENPDLIERLLLETKNRKHVFRWKAPMLEYGVRTNIVARGKGLFVPITGGTAVFPKAVVGNGTQHPGKVKGSFTAAWTSFWSSQVESNFDRVLGDAIQSDLNTRTQTALAKGKKLRKYTNKFGFRVVTNQTEAYEAGREQALTAIRFHQRSIRGIEKNRGRATI